MLKKILIIAALVVVLLIAGLVTSGYLWRAPGEALTPAGIPRNSAYYIDMPDGARIAADLWVPPDLAAEQRIPVVIEGTRYWRDMGLTLPGRIAAMLGMALPGVNPSGYNAFFPANGYAMLSVDVRGTGASSGVHTIEYSLEETDDYRHIIEWAAQQPWSSGEVFAVGVSYSGTSAELMATTGHPALKAVAPLYSDFDAQMQLATPGGAYQPGFIDAWSQLVAAMDRNDLCGVIKASSGDSEADCAGPEMLISGVKPVPGDQAFLTQAVAMHNSPDVATMVRRLTYRDSAWGAGEVTPMQNLPYGRKVEIERSSVPMFVVTGWFDAATTNGALARFATFSNPQEVWIGAFSHGGEHDTDPYKPPDAPSEWSELEQLERVLAFFERHRKPNRQTPPRSGSTLHYYVNGTGTFRQTQTWPPQHLKPRRYYLGPDQTLSESLSNARRFDRYTIDPTTATAHSSRWQTQLDGGDVIYDRRAEMAAKSLVYTSAPYDADTELTGSVVLDLWMTSDQPEGVLHAYLEAVAPNGQVRYLTEGVLNLLHRKNTDNPFYPAFGPAHSFLERDARPIPTGRMFSFSTTLFATSALIKRGHQLRLSLAGANTPAFAPVPAEGSPPQWNVYFGPTSPSSMTIHAAPWPTDTTPD